jgi:tRNA uridine 5-carboxymethylaminomethyl modification enzyme
MDGVRRNGHELLSLPGVSFEIITGVWPELKGVPPEVVEQLEIDAQYAGYLDRQDADIVAFRRDEGLNLPADLDYRAVHGLSTEAVLKLETIRPTTLGQAARIDGVTPAALTLILAAIRARASLARRAS